MNKDKSNNLVVVKNGNVERLELLKEYHIDKDLSHVSMSLLGYGLQKLISNYVLSSPTVSESGVFLQTLSKIGGVLASLSSIGYGVISAYYTYNTVIDIYEGEYKQAGSDLFKAAFFGGASVAAWYYPIDTSIGVATVSELYWLYDKVNAFDTVIERIELTGDKSFVFDLDTLLVVP